MPGVLLMGMFVVVAIAAAELVRVQCRRMMAAPVRRVPVSAPAPVQRVAVSVPAQSVAPSAPVAATATAAA